MMSRDGADDWDEDECCSSLRCPKCWANKVDNEGGLAEMFGYGGREAMDEYEFSDATKDAYRAAYDAFELARRAIDAEGGSL